MTPEISEWVDKAEGYWATVLRESAVTDEPNFDASVSTLSNALKNILKLAWSWEESAFANHTTFCIFSNLL